MRRRLVLLLSLVVLFSCGCAYVAMQPQYDTYELYFREGNLEAAVGSDALRAVPIRLSSTPKEPEALAELLLQKLLEGPLEEALRSTMPQGTALLSVDIEAGQATVDLSAPYGTLSGVSLTLADYAIALTLTQLPEISTVKITVRGQELAYREKQVFQAGDVLLSPKEDLVGTVTVKLYFPGQEGRLLAEERTLELYEGDTQVAVVARALELGPESKDLLPVFPEGFRVKSLWLEEETCYVNLSSALLGYLPQDQVQARLVLEALSRSLCSLEAVSEVRFLVDGEFCQTYGSLQVGAPVY